MRVKQETARQAATAVAKKWVYLFREGNASMRDLLGGKGAGLAEMTNADLPVPPGFTITTEACNTYYQAGQQFPPGMWEQTLTALKEVERESGKRFGDPQKPLLVSVRSGAKFSMPGMMDTVLNLGLNESTLKGLAAGTKNERFALDAYRRFIQMFGKIVLDMDPAEFENILDEAKKGAGVRLDSDLSAQHLTGVVEQYLGLVRQHTGRDFPTDPTEQLRLAIQAVFSSWNNKRAIDYRNFNKIPHDLGTAVNIVAMVFGNLGNDSGTGVAFTRDPATGERVLYGEYLPNAQGEDVVAGIRTPKKIAQLHDEMPEVYQQFAQIARRLEQHYRDAQDLEFTVERGKLYMLQTRTAKRTAKAAVKMAVEMADEKLITREEALLRVEPNQIYQLLLPRFDDKAKEEASGQGLLLATGLNASPGAATGQAIFDADRAEALGSRGEAVILVRPETNPDDVHGMLVAKGILTARGGATSHAAVVARGLGKPCVAGCEALDVDLEKRVLRVGDKLVREGEELSIDGTSGQVFKGRIPTIEPNLSQEKELQTLLKWADGTRRLGVWANADYPRDAQRAVEFGAEGVGLCRTEHMFFEEERLPIVRQMILAAAQATELENGLAALQQELAKVSDERRPALLRQVKEAQTKVERSKAVKDYHGALDQLLQFQRADFKGIFKAMNGRPVIIRLLDPPLHEFLPRYEELLVEVTELRVRANNPQLLAEKEELLRAVEGMREQNPMLGLRGCRLGLLYGAINEMQVRAIFEACCSLIKEIPERLAEVQKLLEKHGELREDERNRLEDERENLSTGIRRGIVRPEVMIPLVGHVNELKLVREQLEAVVKQVQREQAAHIPYKFGTMIEIPRAALTADEIAQYAEFFSFGTNDLTQTTFGYSRDDAEGKFLLQYVQRKILPENPFQVLDRGGVGQLIEMAVKKGRGTRSNLEVGICGEHGGDPSSIEFCHQAGLNYVSCSPFRVPIARLAAAQAALAHTQKERDK